jgi:glycosyltransferase involved in cell wall biosynthesis
MTAAPSASGAPRVLMLLDGLWVGGTERSMVEMMAPLTAAGLDPHLATLRRRDEGVEAEVPPGRLHHLPAGPLLAQARSVRRLARELGADVLHTALFRANLVGRLAALAPAGPVLLNSLVNTPYEPVRRRDPALSARRLRVVQAVDAVSARAVDHFHAVSEAARQAAVRDLRVAPRRITVVRRGRDPRRLGESGPERRHRVRAALGLAADAQVVLTVGRQDFQKGQVHLLRAAARLAPRHPRLVVLVAGRTGPAAAELERLAGAPPLAGRVRLLGHRADVPDLLAAADLLAFPSLFEGFPGAVVEAMGLALPVVAADIPPVRELVRPGETGLLVAPENDAALAAALAELLADPRRAAALGRRGHDVFQAELTLDTAVAGMAALYRRLASGRGRGPVSG